jgi:hypothetical protein
MKTVSLKGPRIFKLLNLLGNQLISTAAAFIFVPSVFEGNIQTSEFGMIPAETACWDIDRK